MTTYSIYDLANAKGTSVPVREALLMLAEKCERLEAQRDKLINQFRILSDDFNSGEYNQYECAFAISDLIAKIEAERKA